MNLTRRHAMLSVLIAIGVLLGWWMIRNPIAPGKTPTTASASNTIQAIPQSNSQLPAPSRPAAKEESVPSSVTLPVDSAATLLAKIEAALSSTNDADWDQAVNQLFPALFAKDRAAAVRLVERLNAGEKRSQLLRRLVQAWASSDFAGAVAWISNLPDFAEQKATFYDACSAAAENNPAEAVHAWESFDFKDDDHVMENLVQHWAGKDLAAAQTWVSNRPAGMQRDQAMARVAYVMAPTNPTGAAALVIREITPGTTQTEAAISILHQWARIDLAGATRWVDQFPPGELSDRARNELAGMAQERTSKGSAPL